MIELNVYSVLYSLLSRHRVVLLKESEGERYLPIWIGQAESEAIVMRLQETTVPRPMTHDLLCNVIKELGGNIQYVIVNDLTDNTFFGRIAVEHEDRLQLIDSRPSDAIAVAVRASVPIYAAESVMDRAAILPSPEIREEACDTDGLDAFRDFLDSLNLDDLGE
ncbi:MAG: bifunctional nuclease family protein [Chloroflexi bacterium]|jgi:bifunctional DNase/RNase|nr:bifunctional nuclease family protein [Chloroflexota bacterium]